MIEIRIDGDGVLKVGDFGLSEDVYRTGYFRLDKGFSCRDETTIQMAGPREHS